MHLVDGSEPATHGSQAAVVDALAVSPQPPTIPGFSLQDRVVVITGGASGLGLVMGKGAVESGAHLAIVDINSSSFPPVPYSPLRRAQLAEARSEERISNEFLQRSRLMPRPRPCRSPTRRSTPRGPSPA